MSITDELLQANERYAAQFTEGGTPMPPGGKVAVVACMDARLDVYRMLGLGLGQAHVIRNAGGAVDDDAIRSLVISQRLLGTDEIILIHHSDCGMLTFADDELKAQSRLTSGCVRPSPSRPSPMSTPTCANRSPGCGPTPSSPTRTCAGSSTRSRPASSAR